jgi:ribonuclease HI
MIKVETFSEWCAELGEGPVRIYTDGSCYVNPGPGGFGVVMIAGSVRYEFNGGEAHTTNNRMEMRAAIEPLKKLISANRASTPVTILTDSRYLMDGITLWIVKWKVSGWKTAQKQDVKNKDLWQQLDVLMSQTHVQWKWVRGHSGNTWNERADMLAIQGTIAQRVGA